MFTELPPNAKFRVGFFKVLKFHGCLIFSFFTILFSRIVFGGIIKFHESESTKVVPGRVVVDL